jgi:hypothetical protein
MPRIRFFSFGCAAAVLVLGSSSADAQRTVAYDTLAETTPAAVTCGFCATEQFGTVFHALPEGTGRGLDPADFPFTLHAILVAVARARVAGGSCTGLMAGGTATFTVRVYAGSMLPEGSIRDLPGETEWPGETLVYEATDVALELSTSDMDGSSRINVMFNMLNIEGGVEVAAGNDYLRVVFTIPAGGSGTDCTAPPLMPAEAYPIRDDGRIADRRSMNYAVAPDGAPAGTGGWYWNEEARIAGDWGVRISITSTGPGTDAGMPGTDAGSPADAGASRDAGGRDAGTVACTVSADCPGGQVCESGRCVTATGGGDDDGGCCSVAPGAPRGARGRGALAWVAIATITLLATARLRRSRL